MTKREIAEALKESERFRELGRESQKRYEAQLGCGEEGNEVQEPVGDVRRVIVQCEVDGQEFPGEVWDAQYDGAARRFTDHVGANQWLSERRQAWRKVHMGAAQRRRLRARLKAEIARLDDLRQFFPYVQGSPTGSGIVVGGRVVDPARSIGAAVDQLAQAFLAITEQGEVRDVRIEEPGPGYAEVARNRIAAEEAAARTEARDVARSERNATRAARAANTTHTGPKAGGR